MNLMGMPKTLTINEDDLREAMATAFTTEELSAVVACAPFSAIVARVWIELAKQPVQA